MFIYHNLNPLNERVGDCVVRAISFGLNIEYNEVLYLLYLYSNYFNCDMLVRDCYGDLLSRGFGLRKYDGMGRTVKEVAEDFIGNKVIMRVDGHLTVSDKNANIIDTWDTSDEIVDCFWVVE